MVSMLISRCRGVAGFCSDVVLRSGLMYFNNFKFGARNTTRIHNSGLTEDLGAPMCVPKWFCVPRRTSSGAQVVI